LRTFQCLRLIINDLTEKKLIKTENLIFFFIKR